MWQNWRWPHGDGAPGSRIDPGLLAGRDVSYLRGRTRPKPAELERVEVRDQVVHLLVGEVERRGRGGLVVELDDLAQRRECAVVHVRRGVRDVAQLRRVERVRRVGGTRV